MKVLVVGGGAREHAIGWALDRSASCGELLFAPGNGGTALLGRNLPIAADYVDGIVAAARGEGVDLVVVGPEGPLVAGLADELRTHGIPVFGPGRDGARLEGSKAWAKQLMHELDIPTARHATFTELEPALDHVRSCDGPIVVKADGLAAGKGVVVADSTAEAEAAVRSMLVEGIHGDAGARVVLEERLTGPELTVMAFVADGAFELLATSRDHKRAFDGDRGPNTGGMGAVSPAPGVDDDVVEQVCERVLGPLVAGLAARGIEYRGVLYAGIMLCDDGPKVIEFNVRLGDPEAQVVLARAAGDLLAKLHAVACGSLEAPPLAWSSDTAVGVVVAAPGYPDAPVAGAPVSLDGANATVFHGGTRWLEGALVTTGGRVFTVVGRGDGVDEARRRAYDGVAGVEFDGAWHRADIAGAALVAG